MICIKRFHLNFIETEWGDKLQRRMEEQSGLRKGY